MRTLHSTALVALALLAGLASTGCSLQVGAAPLEEDAPVVAPPPLLVLESPRADVTYTDADDMDPAPGLQVPLIVRVHDTENRATVLDVEVVQAGVSSKVAVADHAWGRQVRVPVTLAAPGARGTVHLVVRATPQADAPTSARVDDDEEAPAPFEVAVTAHGEAGITAPCAPLLSLHGDLVIASPEDAAALLGESCVAIGGDLVVEESGLDALSGLEPIVSIAGDLKIARNPALESLDALSRVAFVGGDVVITGNAALTDSAGLALVEEIGRTAIAGDVVVGDNGG